LGIEFAAINRHNQLIVFTFDDVAVGKDPSATAFGFVVLEVALEVCSVGVGPSSGEESVFDPFSDILHSSCIEDVCSLAVLLSVQPITGEDILVRINEHSLSRFDPAVPLSVVLALITVDQSPDSVFEVALEVASEDITVGVRVFPLAGS
jgi:hypothetical protein